MPSEAVIFRELTGAGRSIELNDRALPYRPLAFPGSHRYKKSMYPGNPVATIQVLGPEENEIEMRGAWKDRYVGASAILTGFDDLNFFGVSAITAEILVAAFTRLRLSGNQIELSWGPEVRRGMIAKFDPSYQRSEDVEWSLTFVSSQIGSRPTPRVAAPSFPGADLNAALLALLDVGAEIPFFLPNITAALLAAEIAAQFAATSLASSLGSISGIPTISIAEFQGVSSKAESVRTSCSEIQEICSDQPIEAFIPTAGVGAVLEAETWRRAYAAAALVLEAEAIKARESVRSRVSDEAIVVVSVRDNQTLRDLALEYYGSSDAWTTIADFNGLTGSAVASGTRVVIPRVGYQGSATGANV